MKIILALTSFLLYVLVTLAAGTVALAAIELIMHSLGYVWMNINVPLLEGMLIPLIGAPLGVWAARAVWEDHSHDG